VIMGLHRSQAMKKVRRPWGVRQQKAAAFGKGGRIESADGAGTKDSTDAAQRVPTIKNRPKHIAASLGYTPMPCTSGAHALSGINLDSGPVKTTLWIAMEAEQAGAGRARMALVKGQVIRAPARIWGNVPPYRWQALAAKAAGSPTFGPTNEIQPTLTTITYHIL
jgi:hypothetical protein